jgi:hypothetical protein
VPLLSTWATADLALPGVKQTLADLVPSLSQDKRFSGFIPESKCQYPQLGLRTGIVRSGSLTSQSIAISRDSYSKRQPSPIFCLTNLGRPRNFPCNSKVHVPARMFECDEVSDERSVHIGPTNENIADGKKQMAMMTPVPDTVVRSRASQFQVRSLFGRTLIIVIPPR